MNCSGPMPSDLGKSDLPESKNTISGLSEMIQSAENGDNLRKDNEARIIWFDQKFKKTEYVILYLHGFAGSYRDGYPLNVKLAKHYGANIYLNRMAGHGKLPDYAMEDFTAENAFEKATEDLANAHLLGEKVIILSTSTGGTLALSLAATFPDKVHALINISPNIAEEQLGAGLLNTSIGEALTKAVIGEKRKIEYEQDSASLYWDTIYPVDALVELQILLEITMHKRTFRNINCPVLTLYYYENIIEKDRRIDVDEMDDMHNNLATTDSGKKLVKLASPQSHFIGSDIMSEDYQTALDSIYKFCNNVLDMTPVTNNNQKQ